MTLRCEHCEEVIGVYEPMIVLDGGRARATSKAAERDDTWMLGGECFHAACYEQATAKGTAPCTRSLPRASW
jgi:hypothetical protein